MDCRVLSMSLLSKFVNLEIQTSLRFYSRMDLFLRIQYCTVILFPYFVNFSENFSYAERSR